MENAQKCTWVPGGHAKCWLQSVCGGSRPGPAELFFALKKQKTVDFIKFVKRQKHQQNNLELLQQLLFCNGVQVGTGADTERVYFGEGEVCL